MLKGINRSRVLTVILLAGLAYAVPSLIISLGGLHLPNIQQDYEPSQPIAYSHRLHAGEMQIPCLYCHFGAEKSRHAGIPPASVCMNCHGFVTTAIGAVRAEDALAKKQKRKARRIISPELQKLYSALALNVKMKPARGKEQTPIQWVRIHNLPDFAYFDHRPHVGAGVTCQTCHGPVESMERVRQFQALNMGWCVNCHRDSNKSGVNGRKVNAPLDCSACHI